MNQIQPKADNGKPLTNPANQANGPAANNGPPPITTRAQLQAAHYTSARSMAQWTCASRSCRPCTARTS